MHHISRSGPQGSGSYVTDLHPHDGDERLHTWSLSRFEG